MFAVARLCKTLSHLSMNLRGWLQLTCPLDASSQPLSAAWYHRSAKLCSSSEVLLFSSAITLPREWPIFTSVSTRQPFVWSTFRNKANDKKHSILHIFKTVFGSLCRRLVGQDCPPPRNEESPRCTGSQSRAYLTQYTIHCLGFEFLGQPQAKLRIGIS
jgi:hypothetical protein